MKKLLVILLAIGLGAGASAQKIGSGFKGGIIRGGGGVKYVRPQVTVIAPYYPVRPYYGFGYGARFGYGYSPFYDPFYNPRFYRESQPSALDLEIEDIKNEYDFKIDSVKDDKTLTKDERKQRVRDLKHQREDEIIEAKKRYYNAKDGKKDNES